MKVTLMAIGDHEDKYLAEGFALYEKRLQHYVSFDMEIIPSLKKKGQSKEAIIQAEAKEVLKRVSPADLLILLDEKGKEYSSVELANQMQKYLNMPGKRMFFLIGGAFGFSPEIYARATQKIFSFKTYVQPSDGKAVFS